MTEQEKLKIKLEQNETDQSRLTDEMASIEAEIKALDKPKLRHGDYGYDPSGRPTLI